FSFSADGQLKPVRSIEIAPGTKPGQNDFIGDVAVSGGCRALFAAGFYYDSGGGVGLGAGRGAARKKKGGAPFRVFVYPDGKSYLVSSWADGSVSWYEARTGSEITRLRLGPHTTDMVLSDRKVGENNSPWKYRLFVAAANTNLVYVAGLSDSNTMQT